ncbi:MAG: hypothetical protein ACE5IW_09380 [bacterium]
MRILTVVFVVVLLFGSCTSASRKTREYDTAKTKVKVDNQNVMSMTIYVLKRSEQIRLGLVPGLSTRVFAIPDDVVTGAAPVRLLADPVGSNLNPISEEFDVSPGDVIEMVIRPF